MLQNALLQKERDLEIASEIGRTLVKKVRHLDRTVERLTEETELTTAQVTTFSIFALMFLMNCWVSYMSVKCV